MNTHDFKLTLHAPAFLGDANQSGTWRTPPFKALLREWWRIAVAVDHGHDHRRLREAESRLFGNVDLNAEKSKVRLALKHWHEGKPLSFADDPKVGHPEVKFPVGSQLYLGYGPVTFDKASKKTALKTNAALQAGETNTLSLAWPDTDISIPHTLQLINWFGTLGGRSRNGWGSLALLPLPPGEGRGEGVPLQTLHKDHPQLTAVLRDLRQCLQRDWPHALGKDEKGPLIWQSAQPFPDWKAAMTFLARTKIGFRTDLKFVGGQPHRQAQDRHLLAYPVTNHAIGGISRDARLANQLRFKLFHDAQNQLRARIFHTPHASPLPMPNLDPLAQLAVWQKVHAWLDAQANLQRLGGQA